MSVKKIAENNLEKKLLFYAFIAWTFLSLVTGIFFGLMVTGPNQSFNYLLWSIFDISLVCFFGYGILIMPCILGDLFRVSRYKKKHNLS